MTEAKAMSIINEHEALVVGVTYNILFTNDIVCAAIIDMMSELRNSPLYRHGIKMKARLANEHRHNYELRLNEIINRSSNFFAEANDAFSSRVQPFVDHLYYAIKQEFDNHQHPHASVLARMELARTLATYACIQFDERIRMMRERDPQFACFRVDFLRITAISQAMDRLMEAVPTSCTIDLNTTRVKQAVSALQNKLTDANNIAEAISA